MIKRLLRYSAVFAILTLTCGTISSASTQVQRVYGKAHNLSGKIEYVEEHVIKYENDRIVTINTVYYDAETRKIARQSS